MLRRGCAAGIQPRRWGNVENEFLNSAAKSIVPVKPMQLRKIPEAALLENFPQIKRDVLRNATFAVRLFSYTL